MKFTVFAWPFAIVRATAMAAAPRHPPLTLQQAWDVSACVIIQPRPHFRPR